MPSEAISGSYLLRPIYTLFVYCAAYPELHPVQTCYAVEVGQPVTIQCTISPGKLIQRYICVWRNASSFLIHAGNTNYPISYADFSLTILHTTQSDAGTDWHCRVIVDNPQTSYTDDWILESNSITLVVYGKYLQYSEMFHLLTLMHPYIM